jgi:hypothetical protein
MELPLGLVQLNLSADRAEEVKQRYRKELQTLADALVAKTTEPVTCMIRPSSPCDQSSSRGHALVGLLKPGSALTVPKFSSFCDDDGWRGFRWQYDQILFFELSRYNDTQR